MGKTKKVEIPEETLDKLLKNEFQMNSVGTNEIEIPVVEPINSEVEKEEASTKETKSNIKYNDVDYKGRGFKSLQDAIDFMEKPYFKGLGQADKDEYINWLIKK